MLRDKNANRISLYIYNKKTTFNCNSEFKEKITLETAHVLEIKRNTEVCKKLTTILHGFRQRKTDCVKFCNSFKNIL